ncbi:MAG: carbohydrate kinase family protein [Gemmatimonadota bacterium]
MLRLGVLGSINRDTIESAAGRVTESLGGVLYTACAAAYLGDGQIAIRLIARVGSEVEEAVREVVRQTPLLSDAGLLASSGPGFHSHIRYRADGGKREVLTGDLPPLELHEIEAHLADLDGLLVNFITGLELGLSTFAQLRSRVHGPLLADVHSLTLGRRPSGERFWRRPDQWEAWLAAMSHVQMNQEEASLLAGIYSPSVAQLASFAQRVLCLGPAMCAITRGALGAVAAARRPSGQVEVCDAPAPPPPPLAGVDPTGCGDVFLAGLGVAALNGIPPSGALELANRAASLNCELSGIRELDRLAAIAVGRGRA